MPHFPQVEFDALDDGDFFMLGTGLLWQKLSVTTARLLSVTGDTEFDTTVQDMPPCQVEHVDFEDVQQLAEALGVSSFRLLAAVAAFKQRSGMITAKCPPLDAALTNVPRFPKRLLETLAGKTTGRPGAWACEPEQITLRWLLTIPFDKLYNDVGPAYMANNGANGRVMVIKFFEEWGIDTHLMGPSYPFDIHTTTAGTAVTTEVIAQEPGTPVQLDGRYFVSPFALNWEIPLVELLDDGDTNWRVVLGTHANDTLQQVAYLEWAHMCETLSNDTAVAVYNACLTATGQSELPWPLLTEVEAPADAEQQEETTTSEDLGEEPHDLEDDMAAVQESGVLLTREQFLAQDLRASGVLPDVVVYADGTRVSTEGWTGATLNGWTRDEIAGLFADADQCTAFLGWLDQYFDWQPPAAPEQPNSTGGSFALALEAFVVTQPTELRESFLSAAELIEGMPSEQRQQFFAVFATLG